MRTHTARSAASRRSAFTAAAAALSSLSLLPPHAARAERSAMRVSWGPFKNLTVDEMAALDASSQEPDAGSLRASGLRVIDLVDGYGPPAQVGDRVYAHYKIWADGFRSGPTADLSFLDNRPYSWVLGEPTDRIPAGIDEGVRGMREGGWRRCVVPNAYGDAGLRRVQYGPAGRTTGAKAALVVQPNAPAYVDLIMLDAGSGRCARLLRPEGSSERERAKLKSLTCSARQEIY